MPEVSLENGHDVFKIEEKGPAICCRKCEKPVIRPFYAFSKKYKEKLQKK